MSIFLLDAVDLAVSKLTSAIDCLGMIVSKMTCRVEWDVKLHPITHPREILSPNASVVV